MQKKKYDKLEQIESLARRLMATHAPGVVLALYAKPLTTATVDGPNLTEDGPVHTIYWRPQDGLTCLLHEIGHGHVKEPPEPIHPDIKQLFDEVWAWVWAEETARAENLNFDYRAADKSFGSYTRPLGLPIRLRWRYA